MDISLITPKLFLCSVLASLILWIFVYWNDFFWTCADWNGGFFSSKFWPRSVVSLRWSDSSCSVRLDFWVSLQIAPSLVYQFLSALPCNLLLSIWNWWILIWESFAGFLCVSLTWLFANFFLVDLKHFYQLYFGGVSVSFFTKVWQSCQQYCCTTHIFETVLFPSVCKYNIMTLASHYYLRIFLTLWTVFFRVLFLLHCLVVNFSAWLGHQPALLLNLTLECLVLSSYAFYLVIEEYQDFIGLLWANPAWLMLCVVPQYWWLFGPCSSWDRRETLLFLD